jgi:hypothetical protein
MMSRRSNKHWAAILFERIIVIVYYERERERERERDRRRDICGYGEE